ncbi:MAG: phosphotransferase [Actinomycetota bacterium]
MAGFHAVPAPEELSEDGTETLSYLEGVVYTYPLPLVARSERALVSAAKLLREYHDATVPFVSQFLSGWSGPRRYPVEVICHGDFAPYNCVMSGDEVTGIIDFDNTSPGPRLWDVAYAIYRFAPLTAPDNPDGFGELEVQAERARLFCASYGLGDRTHVIRSVLERLDDLVRAIYQGAAAGNSASLRHVAEGHPSIYLGDSRYVSGHAEFLRSALEWAT